MQAYDFVMQAFPHAWMLDRVGNAAAIALLEKAMAADPDYALAFALASWCEGQKSMYQWTENSDVAKQKALSLARRAFSLDPNDPTALTALGTAQTFAGEIEGALENIGRALDIDPSSAWAWSRKGWLNYYVFDFSAGVSAFENALRLSPLDPMNFNCFIGLGAVHMAGEKYGEAIKYIQRGLRENPDALWAYRILAICYAHQGHKEEAKKCVDILQQEYPDLNVDTIMGAVPLQDTAVQQRYRQGLILAGVPGQ
jgi:adenylate cyclase